MNRMIRRLIALASMAPFAVASAATALEADAEHAWAAAKRHDTLTAYAEFAMTYPDSRYASEARRRISGQNTRDDEKQVAAAAVMSPGVSKQPDLVPDSISFI